MMADWEEMIMKSRSHSKPRWRIYDETVELVQLRHQFFPQRFRWRNRVYTVRAVERTWTRPLRQRRFFQVDCSDGTFEIFQDLRTGIWELRRARLIPNRIPSPHRLLPVWQWHAK
jgi:hypothetical protein